MIGYKYDNYLHVLANFIWEISRERTFADPGGVGLDGADGGLDGAGIETQAGGDSRGPGGAAGHVGIGAEVQIQHGRVGTFRQKPQFVVPHHFVHQQHCVLDHIVFQQSRSQLFQLFQFLSLVHLHLVHIFKVLSQFIIFIHE